VAGEREASRQKTRRLKETDENIWDKSSSKLKGRAIVALNTQTNQAYLHLGAINKPQFQFLSSTASMIGPCNS